MSENKQQKWRVGITGGIGSGKTTVCHLFETLGIPVYYADYWAKWLLENDPELIAGVRALFGEEAYLNGVYNRAFIAKIVFILKFQFNCHFNVTRWIHNLKIPSFIRAFVFLSRRKA